MSQKSKSNASDKSVRPTRALVPEVPYACKDHRQPQSVRRFDHFLIADRSAGLNNGRGAGFGDFLYAVGERKESVGGGNRPFQRKHRFLRAEAAGIYAAHLSGP